MLTSENKYELHHLVDESATGYTSATEVLNDLLPLASQEWVNQYQFIRAVTDELQSITGISFNVVQSPVLGASNG